MATLRARLALLFQISWPEISNKFDRFKLHKLKNSKSNSRNWMVTQLQEQGRKTYPLPVQITFQDKFQLRSHCKISQRKYVQQLSSNTISKLALKPKRTKSFWMNSLLINSRWPCRPSLLKDLHVFKTQAAHTEITKHLFSQALWKAPKPPNKECSFWNPNPPPRWISKELTSNIHKQTMAITTTFHFNYNSLNNKSIKINGVNKLCLMKWPQIKTQ